MRKGKLAVLFTMAVASVSASAAFAQAPNELLSFTYSDLTGAYDSGTSLFTAADDGDSDGDVTRLVSPASTVYFNGTTGAGGFPAAAAFDITMTVSGANLATANGAGTITLTDINGDQYTGNLSGTWINVAGSANFVGILSGIGPNDVSSDGTFDGNTGSFPLNFGAAPPYSGNVITLAFQNWFTNGAGAATSFSNSTTLASGVIVPEPATLGLLLLGGLIAGRRVRR